MAGVLVLGAGGMLGGMLARTLPGAVAAGRSRFEAGRDDPGRLLDETGCRWVVNAIGVIKPRIDEADPASVERALEINGRFPHQLAEAAGARGARVIHVTTDGVFSGRAGPYAEDAPHDATDVYAVSKSRGEVEAPHVVSLRCSIVGPEPPPGSSLLAWLLSQPPGARVSGFTDQRWNGVTTLHLARLCAAIVREQPALPPVLHVVPGDAVTKADLLGLLAVAFGREDIAIERRPSGVAADRSLTTLHPELNALLWQAAGYPAAPTVGAMVQELATTTPLTSCAISPSSSVSGPT